MPSHPPAPRSTLVVHHDDTTHETFKSSRFQLEMCQTDAASTCQTLTARAFINNIFVFNLQNKENV